jgi:LPS export ABC transporter protein LptC
MRARRIVALLLAATGPNACSAKGPATQSPAPASHVAASSAATTNAPGKHTPILFEAPHTGNRYIYNTEQRGNRKVYVLRADSEKGVYFGENTGQSTFVNPHITFFGTDGKQLVADAPSGLAVERAKTIELMGGVHALSQDGIRLTSRTMTYDGATETIHAQGNVVMDSAQGNELRGDTLDWNLHSGAVDVAGAH